jgi:dihydrofolate synthase/folylpolyglutamate synthase
VREEFGFDQSQLPSTNLDGDYQRRNAATAALAAKVSGRRWRLTPQSIAKGLQHVSWAGRWQTIKLGGRALILDASHNPEGADVLDANLRRLVEGGRQPLVVVAGVLGSARARPLIATICRYAREVHFVVPQQARACSYEQLESLVPSDYTGVVRRGTVDKIFPRAGRCDVGNADDVVLVTGSIYLLGEVLARIEPERGAGEGSLQDF